MQSRMSPRKRTVTAMRYVGIDPSTKTGFVALDQAGNVLVEKELTGIGKEDPKRMASMIREVIAYLRRDDVVCIEGFGFASQQAVQLGGIGWGIRIAMYCRGMEYIEAAPSQLKKFASGKGTTKKDELGIHIYKRWGYEHRSDNVRDAYVLARIAMEIDEAQKTGYIKKVPIHQGEVVQAILHPPEKKKKKKRA